MNEPLQTEISRWFRREASQREDEVTLTALVGEREEAGANRAASLNPDTEANTAQDDITWLGITLCCGSAIFIAGTLYVLVKVCGEL